MEKETTLNEVMEFLKDNMVTKEDTNNFTTKDDLVVLENRLTTRIDAKIDALDNKMTMELRSIQTELDDIKLSLARLEQRTREDSDSGMSSILDLRRRVQELEQQVKRLQAA